MSAYEHEDGLPALPVPGFEESCALLLDLIAPLVDEGGLERTRLALKEFSAPDGPGRVLHDALLGYRKGLGGNASWLRPFWDDMYLSWRGPLPIDMNYVFCLDGARWGGRKALPRFLRTVARLFRLIGSGVLEAENSGGAPLSMEQLKRCVYTRIPGRGADLPRAVPLGGALSAVVVCGGRWFTLPLCDEAGGLAGEDALAEALEGIRHTAGKAAGTAPTALGAFTTAGRELAAELREVLLMSRQNRLSLAEIENAALVLCLDEALESDDDLVMSLLCGPAANRFFDKSLQVVSSANHGLGLNFEHSGCDAGIWLYLMELADYLLTESDDRLPAMKSARPRALPWDIPAALEARFAELAAEFAARSGNLTMSCREYPHLSRTALKALGSSPDAFIQLAFQLARYRMCGKLSSTYEAVSVRAFAQGRTEAGRPATPQVLDWVRAVGAGTGRADLRSLYRLAETAHKARLRRCQQGLGAERHFYGLQSMYELYGARLGLRDNPSIFSDPGWLALKHDALSTSGIGAPFIRYFAFGPVVENGLGLGYAPCAERSGLCVTGWRGKSPAASDFAAEFEKAAETITWILRN